MAQQRERRNDVSFARMGGVLDGLSYWVDRFEWPAARSGEATKAFEPPMAVSAKRPNNATRLKQLGNAVVPLQALPIFLAIMETHAITT